MTVEHAQTPGRHDQQPRAGKQNPDERDGDLALFAREPGSNDGDEERCDQDAAENQRGGGQPEQTEHGAGYPARFLSLLPSKQLGVDRNEGGGEDPFTEEILQEVRDLEGGIEGISRIGGAEIVGEDPVPNQSEEPA